MNAHRPMAKVSEDFVFFLRNQSDGSRWPVGTRLYAETPLIAALPELLEALKTVSSSCPDDIGNMDGAVLVALTVEEVLLLRAAITKATGGAK